jgi:predicted enzyme related to lactoylglutathione lyase
MINLSLSLWERAGVRAILLPIFDCRLPIDSSKLKSGLISAFQSKIENWQSAMLKPSPKGRGNQQTVRRRTMANPFVHVELNTTDVEKAKSFYSRMFDWEMEEMDMGPSGTYTVIKVGDGTGGGLLKNPMPGVPSFWLAYVLVDDIHAATEKARSLGAKIVKDSIEVPNMGWLTIIGDPTGAALGFWQTKHDM